MVRTQITLSDDLVRNVQVGSVKIDRDILMFDEYVARHGAPIGAVGYSRSFNHMTTVIVTKKDLSAVRIPLNEETESEYTVDKYTDLVNVLKNVTGSE